MKNESTALEKDCDEKKTGLQNFNEQEPRIKNTECEQITSKEGKDTVITGLFRENFEQNLTRSDEGLVDILVDLGDKFPKLVPPETDQNKTAI